MNNITRRWFLIMRILFSGTDSCEQLILEEEAETLITKWEVATTICYSEGCVV